jgi:hypothetical protein
MTLAISISRDAGVQHPREDRSTSVQVEMSATEQRYRAVLDVDGWVGTAVRVWMGWRVARTARMPIDTDLTSGRGSQP